MRKIFFSSIVIFISNIVSAQTVSFNFTAAAATVSGWTNVAGDPSTAVRSATSSGITVSSVAAANWKAYSGSSAFNDGGMTTGTYFPAGVMVNHWFQFNEPPSTVATYNVSAPQLEISGLDAASKYTIKMTGSNRYTLNSTIVSYRVAGYASYGPQTLNTMNNTSGGVEFNDVFADIDGKIRIYVNTVTSPSATQLANISGLQVITAVANVAPVPDAGVDQTVYYPASSATLSGSATDADGTIASYAWTKISGASCTITSPASASTTVTGLAVGSYIFRLTVTDNVGSIRSNDMTLTLNIPDPVDTSLLVHKTGNETIDSTKTFLKDIMVNGLTIGKGSGVQTNTYNTAIGIGALLQNTTGSSNTAIGNNALKKNANGFHNTAVGSGALESAHSGDNTAVGMNALWLNSIGYGNTAIGVNALMSNVNGYSNAALGAGALYNVTSGDANTALGSDAARGISTGNRNVVIGYNAGYNTATLGNGNILIGPNVMYNNLTLLNDKLVIGNKDNDYILEGDFSNKKLKISGYQNSSLLDSVLTTDIDGNIIMKKTEWYRPVSSNHLFNNNTGNVYIGSSASAYTDTAYKLFVEKGIRTRKVKVDQSAWADFVFNDDYQLPSLETVHAFIKQNKHLPGLPSAAEVTKDGVDVGQNQAVLLQKIEELTLYIIEQDKRIKALEQIQEDIGKLKALVNEGKK